MVTQIRFNFCGEKALQAICHCLSKLGSVDKVKLMKLLYLAERHHFLTTGRVITGDRLVAMPYGPVPSGCLSLVNGDGTPGPDYVFERLKVENNRVSLTKTLPPTDLDRASLDTLDFIVSAYGQVHAWALVEETHRLPEFVKRFRDGTSRTIFYEDILEFGGVEHMRYGRPVVSADTVAVMNCPFPQSDADL